MAEQAVSSVASAVIGGITDRTLSTVMRKLHAPAAAHEKLQRLEMLHLKLRGAIEVSEKHAIESTSLLQWRDRLKAAAAEVLLRFHRRATEDDQQQQGRAGAGALFFTRSALSGMAQRMRRLFSTDEDMEKLNSSLERLEKLSPDITQFALMLQLDVLPKLEQRPAKRKRAPLPSRRSVQSSRRILRSTLTLPGSEQRLTDHQRSAKAAAAEEAAALAEASEDEDKEAMLLGSMLEQVLRCMAWCVDEAAEDRDMEGFVWMAQWVDVLREAVQRGDAVLSKAGGDFEDDQLYSFARAVDWLAWDMPCLDLLLPLCPWN